MAEHDNRNEAADLKRREYRDEDGNIHHHTHPYMEQHSGGRGERRSAKDSAVAERSASHTSSHGSEHGHAAHPLTDHDEIRRWAEARGGKPACVKGTGRGGDVGMIRLDFPGFSGGDSLEHISWDDWFKAFEENELALIVQERTAGGEESNFNKLISRDSARRR